MKNIYVFLMISLFDDLNSLHLYIFNSISLRFNNLSCVEKDVEKKFSTLPHSFCLNKIIKFDIKS